MRLVDATLPMFARHETFHPRYGWFRKAYRFAAWDPYIFRRSDAPVLIGVRKNMARSIRFWGLAARLLVEDPKAPNPRSPGLVPTRFGYALFGDDGWDPYMEDPGTLWLLHWLLLAPRSRLPVWWLAFNEFHAVEFEDNDLHGAVETHLEAVADWGNPHPTSRKKDVSALLRTYGPPVRSARSSIDDILDCPLRELRLINRSHATGKHRFTLGPKPTLPPEIVTSAALDFIKRSGTSGSTVTLSRLAHEAGAPGRAFKLTESELSTVMESTVKQTDDLDFISPTGGLQLSWRRDPAVLAVEVLNNYYNGFHRDVPAGHPEDRFVDEDGRDLPVDDDLLEAIGLGRTPSKAVRDLDIASGLVVG